MTKETKQQTALDLFIEQLEVKGNAAENSSIKRINISIDTSDYIDLKIQAKEMEMGQHNKTWESSKLGYTGDPFRDSVFGQVKDFGEYYQETYGGNK